jgi:structure-specific recognition protein 1
VKCNLKASDGVLYPLERGLIFIHKPTVYISLEDIKQVDVDRVSELSTQRTFDIKVITKKEEYQFNGLEKEDYEPITKYFSNKKVKLVNSEQGNNIDVIMTVKIFINLF